MTTIEPGRIIAGRYQVIRELGRGGMGIVHVVEHLHTGDRLALKMLGGMARFDPQAIARLKREARASAQIRSEHVVRVTDADVAPELDGSPFLVMELLEGTDLEKFVVERGPMPAETLISIYAQIGPALSLAHRAGIVHRDLKPENLFLHTRSDGTRIAKILDFGISKMLSPVGVVTEAGMTATGSVVGTPLYMAPEQAHAENDKIGPWTDIWALGLVTMRLLTAEHYWDPSSIADLMTKLVVKPILPPSERWPGAPFITPLLDEWFLRSCSRDPAGRWSTVDEQIERLAVILGVTPRSVIPVHPAPARPDRGDESISVSDAESEALRTTASPVTPRRGAVPSLGEESEDVAPLARSSTGRPHAARSRVAVLATLLVLGPLALALFRLSGSRPPDVQRTGASSVVETASPPPPRPSEMTDVPAPSTSTAASAAPGAVTSSPTAIPSARPPVQRPAPQTRAEATVRVSAEPKPEPPAKAPEPPAPSVDLFNRRK